MLNFICSQLQANLLSLPCRAQCFWQKPIKTSLSIFFVQQDGRARQRVNEMRKPQNTRLINGARSFWKSHTIVSCAPFCLHSHDLYFLFLFSLMFPYFIVCKQFGTRKSSVIYILLACIFHSHRPTRWFSSLDCTFL